jgi:hypothetical protein
VLNSLFGDFLQASLPAQQSNASAASAPPQQNAGVTLNLASVLIMCDNCQLVTCISLCTYSAASLLISLLCRRHDACGGDSSDQRWHHTSCCPHCCPEKSCGSCGAPQRLWCPSCCFHKYSYITLNSLAAVGHYCPISYLQRIAIRFFNQPKSAYYKGGFQCRLPTLELWRCPHWCR